MLVLGIESSCDETSAAVVEDGTVVHSLVIASQTELHAHHAGVVPEVASRAHTEQIQPVVHQALGEAGLSREQARLAIDAVAVTTRPGLSGSLAVGLSFAKGWSLATGVPLVAVDHLAAHAYAVQLEEAVDYPYLVLLVSGGHTMIGIARGPVELEALGSTIDDACGEVFDKVSTHLGFGYPGGPAIEAAARAGRAEAARFPVPTLKGGASRLDFSFSGLKTAVIHQRDRFWNPDLPTTRENVAAAFQAAAIAQLRDRVTRAAEATGIGHVVLGGGVAANRSLREAISGIEGVELAVPRGELCLDNGAMVAGLGFHVLAREGATPLTVGVSARVAAFRGGGRSRPPTP